VACGPVLRGADPVGRLIVAGRCTSQEDLDQLLFDPPLRRTSLLELPELLKRSGQGPKNEILRRRLLSPVEKKSAVIEAINMATRKFL
jgi:hypothetical protein